MNNKNLDSQHKALEELSRKVHEATKEREPIVTQRVDSSGMGVGMRMASEFASAILVGVLLGFGFDNWLKSQPIGLVLGLGFGFAAGVVNLIRASKAYAKDKPLGQDLPPSPDDDQNGQ